MRKPAPRARGSMRSKCWRARISVGAISAACRPASSGARHGQERDDGLARADVALQQAQHALVGGEIAADVGDRPLLRAREREGQGAGDLADEAPVAGVDPPGSRRMRLRTSASASCDAEKLVVGEPPAGGLAGQPFLRDGRPPPADGGPLSASAKPGKHCARARPGPAIRAAAAGAPEPRRRTWQPAAPTDLRSARRPPRRRAGSLPRARRGRGRDGPSGDSRPRARSCRRRSAARRPAAASRCARAAC